MAQRSESSDSVIFPPAGTLKLEGLPGGSLNGRSGHKGGRQNGAVASQWSSAKSVQLADL